MLTLKETVEVHVDAWSYQIASTFQNVWAKLVGSFSIYFGLHIAGFYGDGFLIAMLLKLMLLDLCVGIWDAKKNDRWNPNVFIVRGAVKFPLYAVYVYLMATLDNAAERVFHIELPIVELFLLYLISAEVYSICRHLRYIGFHVPEVLLWLSFGFKKKAEQKIKEMTDGHGETPPVDETKPQDHNEQNGE